MKRTIATAFLAAVTSAASAQQAATPIGRYVLVEEGATPPAGYLLLVPSYEWKDGRFVRNGTVYQSLDGN